MHVSSMATTNKAILFFSFLLFFTAAFAAVTVVMKTLGGLILISIAGIFGYVVAVIVIARFPARTGKIPDRRHGKDPMYTARSSVIKVHLRIICVSSCLILSWILNSYIPAAPLYEKEFTVIKKLDARPKGGWQLVLRYNNGATKFLFVKKYFWDNVDVNETIVLELQRGILGFAVIRDYGKKHL